MKFSSSLLLLSGAIAFILTATPTFSQSNPNNGLKFSCDVSQEIPKTVVSNLEKKEIISWKKDYIASDNLNEDCKKAANILQSVYNDENKYLSIDNVSNKPQTTVCSVEENNEVCDDSSRILFRISPNYDYEDLVNNNIVHPGLIKKEDDTVRTIGRVYSRPRKWFGIF